MLRKSPKIKDPYSWVRTLIMVTLVLSMFSAIVVYPGSLYDFLFALVDEEKQINWANLCTTFISALAAWGPFSLGLVAASQTESLKKLEEKIAQKDSSCNIYLENYFKPDAQDQNWLSNQAQPKYKESKYFICLTFSNYSNPFLKQIKIWFDNNIFESSVTIVQENPKTFRIFLPKTYTGGQVLKCRIAYTSCYDEITFGDFEVHSDTQLVQKKILYYHFYGTKRPNNW